MKKDMMKKLISIAIILFVGLQLWSQQMQTVIVEHFTNSRCSICAARNPTFYDLLNNYPEVLHIAYHPSSPYATCIFSQHNPSENDARTNYYGIYGGTPRVVVQGKVIQPQNPLLMASQIEDKLGQEANYSISVEQIQNTSQEADVTIVIKKVGANDATLNLYAVIAESEVNYNAPNGETIHHDVFRKNLFDIPVSLTNIGDSVILTGSYSIHGDWVTNQMYIAAMLQDASSKSILQSKASELLSNPQSVAAQKITVSDNLFVPNPAVDYIRFNNAFDNQFISAEIYNLQGQKIISVQNDHIIDVSELSDGMYIAIARTNDGKFLSSKFLKRSN